MWRNFSLEEFADISGGVLFLFAGFGFGIKLKSFIYSALEVTVVIEALRCNKQITGHWSSAVDHLGDSGFFTNSVTSLGSTRTISPLITNAKAHFMVNHKTYTSKPTCAGL